MLRRGMSQIADKLNLRGPALVVFNSLSWPRSGEVETDINRGDVLVDLETGKPVELELLRHMPDEEYDRVRLRAVDVPALGYRCYGMVPRGSIPEKAKDEAASNTIESRYYRVTVDPERGGIASIYDKTLGVELVDASSAYALDQYVYAGYGHEGEDLIQQRVAEKQFVVTDQPCIAGRGSQDFDRTARQR